MAGPWEKYQSAPDGPWSKFSTEDATKPVKIGREAFADDLASVISDQNPITAAIAQGGNTAMQYVRGLRQMIGMDDIKDGKNRDALGKEINKQFPIAGPVGDIGAQIGLTYLGAKALPLGAITTKAPVLANPYVANASIGMALGGLKYGDLEQRATDAALGGAGGAAGTFLGRSIPAVYGGLKGIVEPFTNKGQENITGRTLRRFAVDPSRLERAGDYVPSVPGVKPTLAEAALDPGISNLQRQFAVGTADQQLANNAARVQALRAAGGSESAIAAATNARSAAVDPLYKIADEARVTSDEQLRGIMKRLPSGTLSTARDIARMNGSPIQYGRDVSAQTIFRDAAGEIIDPAMLKMPPGPKPINLLAEIKKDGGINRGLYAELGLSPKEAVRGNPGLFRKEGMSDDGLVEWMQQKGWMTDDMIERANRDNPGGAHEIAKDYIRNALEKYPVYHPSQAMEIAAHDDAVRKLMDFQSNLTRTDIPERNAQYTGKGIDLIKKSIDDKLNGDAGSSIGKNQKEAMQGVKADLLDWVDSRIPEYAQARQQFADLSKPINSMNLGNEILRRSSSAAEDAIGNPTLRNEALSRTLRDGNQLAKKVTGFNKSTLKETLDSSAYRTVMDVRKDLARKAASENLGKSTGSPTAQNLAAQNVMRQIAGPLGAPAGFAEANIWPTLLRPVSWAMKAQDPKIEAMLIKAMQDPKFAAELAKRRQVNSAMGSLIGPVESYAIPGISAGLLSEHR